MSPAVTRSLCVEPFRVPSEVQTLFSTKDGRSVFAVHENGNRVTVIESATGTTQGELHLNRESFAVSADGLRLCGTQPRPGEVGQPATADFGVWSWPEREERWMKKMPHVLAARFSPDGTLLAVVTQGPRNVAAPGYEISLLRTPTGEEVWKKFIEGESASFCHGVAFMGPDHLFVSLHRAGPLLRIYRVRGGDPVELPVNPTFGPYKLAAAADAPALLAYCEEDYHVFLTDAQGAVEHLSSGQAKVLADSRHAFRGGAVSPDGQRVLLATRAGCRLHRAEGGESLAIILARGDVVHFMADGKSALLAFDHNLVFLPADTWRPAIVPGFRAHVGRIETLRFSPDGKHLATTDGEDLIVWDLNTGAAIAKMRSPTEGHDFRSIEFHPGQSLIYGDTGPETWWWDYGPVKAAASGLPGDAAEPARKRVMHLRKPPESITFARLALDEPGARMLISTNAFVSLLQFAPDPRDPGLQLRQLTLEGWPGREPVRASALSANGKRAVLASLQDVRVYDLGPDRLVREQKAQSAVPSPNASYFAVPPSGAVNTLAIHDAESGALEATLVMEGDDSPTRLIAHRIAWSPNSARLTAEVFGPEKSVTGYVLWDVTSARRLGFVPTNRGRAAAFAFDQHATRLAAANGDGSIHIWDLERALPQPPAK